MQTQKRIVTLLLCALAALVCLCACGGAPTSAPATAAPTPSPAVTSVAEDALCVQFLDVGQADCVLIRQGTHAMLVDAGNNDDEAYICQTLAAQGVSTLECVVGTHPHEDHIGSLDAVIRTFDVQRVLMPKVQANTRTFEDVLDAIAQKQLRITTPQAGMQFALGQAQVTVLGPVKDYGKETNNWSIGLRVVYGDTAFVLCGDAEAEAEADMLQTGQPLHADVLKLGHHGSRTSSSDAFLAAVRPSAVVISCGKDNSYGHPHAQTLQKLAGVSIYRTDTQGTVTALSDGRTVRFETAVQPAVTPTPAAQTTYVLNTGTRKFHLPHCSSVAQIAPGNREDCTLTREALLERQYTPCGACRP